MEKNKDLSSFQLNLLTADGKGVLGRILQMIYKSNCYLKNVNIHETDVNEVLLIAVVVVMPIKGIMTLISDLKRIIEVEKVVCMQIDNDEVRTIAHYRLSKAAFELGLHLNFQKYGATIISMDKEGFVVEKIGARRDVLELYRKLEGPHQLSFCCSSLQAHESLSELTLY